MAVVGSVASHARGPVGSKVFCIGVVAHETLQLQARADLILRRIEYDQGVHKEPPAERGKGELVADDFGQQDCEVEAVLAREENGGATLGGQ